MKKLMLMAAMVLSSLCMSAADEVTAKVSGTNLNIGLVNETSYVAFQMDIKLPAGVSASSIEAVANRLSQEGSDSEIGGTKFIVASNVLEGNVLRVIAYNLANAAIKDAANSDILAITLNVAPAAASDIKITNIKFVTAEDLAEMNLADVTGENGAILGDVTGDGLVKINDVTAAISLMLQDADQQKEYAKTKKYNFNAADIDGNGVIMINDIASVIKIFLAQ